MFRPGNLGHLGRLGLVAASRPSLVAQALAILAKYGGAANLYLPGVGAISGITAGNWLDTAGTTAATVDNPVGLVVSAGNAVGPELIDYSSGVLGSNYVIRGTSVAVGGGFYTVTGNNAIVSAVASSNPLLGANKTYKVTLSIQSAGPVALHLSEAQNSGVNPSPFLSQSSVGTYDAVITTDFTKDTITAFCGGTGVSTTFKVSVRELPGAHLTQSTAANRPVLRRGLVNQLTQSDFQNGVTDAPTRGGLVTASTLAGYGGAIAFGHDGSATSYGYKLFAATLNAAYTLAFVVKMDDGNAPVFGNVNSQDASNTFAVVMYGNAYSPIGAGGYTVTALADNTYLVTCSAVATAAVATNFGVVKYPANNNRTFKVTRYGLFTGTVTASQILAAGGIPLTTTAPASSTNGPFAWQFDGSNDSFTSTLTTGNAGWICADVSLATSALANQTIFYSGAGTDAEAGIWLTVSGAQARFRIGDGVGRNNLFATNVPIGPRFVLDAGWGGAVVTCATNGVESTLTKTINPTSTRTISVGMSTIGWPLSGTIGATIIMPTVLPTATERATLRQFIASLSGVTM